VGVDCLSGLAQVRGRNSEADGLLGSVGGVMLTRMSGESQPAGTWVVLFDRSSSLWGVGLLSNAG